MKKGTSKKKMLAAAILTTGLALTITQAATARPGGWGNNGQVPCQMQQQLNPVAQKAQEKFLTDTTELRKEMAVKQTAMRAVMGAETPNSTKAAQLAGELYDLREQLRLKAQEYGLPASACGMGQGMGMGQGGGKGFHHQQRRGCGARF
ncbi:hypothetical protein [Desulfogranum mediterraneum]|uniref:hypothetical protein n=1 Tax=Desulfogranum mediterraneum TaxID=160661 RepID=UPI00042231B4|nr:hypothetical protein [Desulfogranum mediterraneum]